MFSVNGVAYSKFSRLTFDGRRRGATAIDQSWDATQAHFDTGNEYSDLQLIDLDYGIRGGFKGHGFAETSILRTQFLRNRVAGVSLGNFNALDIWIWDSRFEDCGYGVTNGTGAGNFHVYSSVFRRSVYSDLAMAHTGGFSARGNYSRGSRAFFLSVATLTYPATIHLQRNTIIDPGSRTPIDLKNQGPGVLTDNVIRSRDYGPVVRWNGGINGADVSSIGNTYTAPNPIENNGRLLTVNDRTVSRSAITSVEPVLPGTPPNLQRSVYEIGPGATAADIQNAIDQAALDGNRSVVHIAHGTYAIDHTITIPQSDVQLVGDGYGTILHWTGGTEGPLLRIQGPSRAALRDLQIDGVGQANGIAIENADQIGARVYLEQLQLRSGTQTDLDVNGIQHATVELRDFGHAYSPTATSVKVAGGPLLAGGEPPAGRTNIFSGAAAGHTISYDVSSGARLLVRDVWYESGAGAGFAAVHDTALFTIDGARVSSPINGAPAFDIADLNGRAAIVATHIDDRIEMTGNGQAAQVLALGVFAHNLAGSYFWNFADPAAHAVLINSRHRTTDSRSIPTANVGESDATFVENLLSHTRQEMPAPLRRLTDGITDVRMFRVWVTRGLNNLTITP
jgi:hypothetical protein